MENKYQIMRGHEIDNYTQKKYYLLYIILNDNLSINVNFVTEDRVAEDIFNINIYFNDGTHTQLFIQKKSDPKNFTFLKKRMEKKLQARNKDTNYIIRISENEQIFNADSNKDLLTAFTYIDL